jgi:hypothetical protein
MNSFMSLRLRQPGAVLGLAAAAILALAPDASAALVVNIQSVSASAGSTGNALDVTLQNTGTSAVSNIGAYAFEITVPSNSAITFTAVNTSTTTFNYIFAGTSFFQNVVPGGISVQPPNLPGQTLEAQDITTSTSGITLNANSSLGLGHILFNVAPGAASGAVTVTPAPNAIATNLSNVSDAPLTLNTLNSGTITIQGGAAVPEPSSLLLALLAAATLSAAVRVWRAVGRGSARSAAKPNA